MPRTRLGLFNEKFVQQPGHRVVDEFASVVTVEPADSEPFLRNLLGAFREGRWPDTNPELAREELARLAASKAIRLPQVVGDAELRVLVTQLFATRAPLTSPSGRPTFIELNHGELSRRFQK